MNVGLDAQTVLVGDYIREISSTGARLSAKLIPAIKLPFNKKTLKYHSHKMDSVVGPNDYPGMQTWSQLMVSVLKEVMPDYVGKEPGYGEDYFYNLKDHSSSLVGYGDFHDIDKKAVSKAIDYGHYNDDSVDAWCRFHFHSPENFYPVVSKEHPDCPTIDTIFMQGYVRIRGNIIKGNDNEHTYSGYIFDSIARALLSGNKIVLNVKDNRIRTGQVFYNHFEYVQISDPTISRMKEAISESKKVEEFFSTNNPVLQDIAKLVDEAYASKRTIFEIRDAHKEAHKTLAEMYSTIKSKCFNTPDINVDAATVKYFEEQAESLLKKANDLLNPLCPSFKSNLFGFAMQEEEKIRDTRNRNFYFQQ